MVRSGKYPYGGRDPFGWTRDKNVLKIVPEEADIIKDMTQKNLCMRDMGLMI